jgi:hypothetical protein
LAHVSLVYANNFRICSGYTVQIKLTLPQGSFCMKPSDRANQQIGSAGSDMPNQ